MPHCRDGNVFLHDHVRAGLRILLCGGHARSPVSPDMFSGHHLRFWGDNYSEDSLCELPSMMSQIKFILYNVFLRLYE